MTNEEFQQACNRTLPIDTHERLLTNLLLGLSGECGEVLDIFKKHFYHQHDLDLTKVHEELGDLAFYLASLCNLLDFDLASVFDANVAKLERRYPNGFSAQASKERVDVPR